MRISKLELYGFKSFPNRTVFNLQGGISCVVGPNGSGKSNVVDALKWVIGEMSAKSLRGADMQDVIFAGSQVRKPVGFAEVQLTLVGEDQSFPGVYSSMSEIQIGRRLHRSGASEYIINRVRVRRRDVVDLLMDTGIGNNLYSFIEQGQVDKMVSASPIERRSLIDEAAGITRYKIKREEANKRLEETSTQLDRAADVMDELTRRLAVLERQVVKAAKFRRLSTLVRQNEIALGMVRFSELAADRKALRLSLREARVDERAVQQELERLESDLASRREEVQIAATSYQVLRDQVAELDATLRELERTRQLQLERDKELGDQVQVSQAEAELANDALQTAELDAKRADEEAVALSEHLLEQGAAATTARRAAEEVNTELVQLQSQAIKLERKLDRKREEQASLRAENGRLSAIAESLPSDLKALTEEREELQERKVALEEQIQTDAAQQQPVLLAFDEATSALNERKEEEKSKISKRATVRQTLREREGARSQHQDERASLEASALREITGELSRARKGAHQTRQEVSNTSRRAQREVQQRTQGAAKERRTQEADVAARGRQWMLAHEQRGRSLVSQIRSVYSREVGALKSQSDQALRELRQKQQRALETVKQTVLQQTREQKGSIEGERAAATKQVQSLSSRLRSTHEVLRTKQREQAQLTSSINRDTATVSAQRVQKDFKSSKPLLDFLPAEDHEAAVSALGDVVLLPAVTKEDLKAVRQVSSRVVVVEHPVSLSQILKGVVQQSSLEEALNHSNQAVLAPGLFIDARGVAHPITSSSAKDAKALRGRLKVNRAKLKELDTTVAHHNTEIEAVSTELEEAQNAVLLISQRLAAFEQSASERLRVELAEVREGFEEESAEVSTAQQQKRTQLDESVSIRLATVEEMAGAERKQLTNIFEAVVAQFGVEQAVVVAEKIKEAERSAEELVKAAEVAAQKAEALVVEMNERLERERAAFVATYTATGLELHEAVVQVRAQLDEADAAVHTAEQLRQAQQQTVNDLDREILAFRAESKRKSRHLQELESRRKTLTNRRDDLSKRLKDNETSLALTEQKITTTDERCQTLRTELVNSRTTLAVLVTNERTAMQEASAGEVKLAGLKERHVAAVSRKEAALGRAREAAERKSRAVKQIETLSTSAKSASTAAEEARTSAEEALAQRTEAWDRSELAQQRSKKVKVDLQTAEQGVRALFDRRQVVVERVRSLEESTATIQRQLDTLRATIDDRYQVSLPGMLDRLFTINRVRLKVEEAVEKGITVGSQQVAGVPTMVLSPGFLEDAAIVESMAQDLKVHRAQLAQIGQVHLGALEEYEEVALRHADLTTQVDDLDASIRTIRTAIAKMNKLCRERFRDAYDQVNAGLTEAYPRLVGGGQARLSLTDDDDLLETGVEIFVQPPGKRLQNLTLLSGGEKAMAAIALLISLFRVKPSPFCVLDEVDAPLDEANGSRFNEMLREMSKFSQFLVITHNRKTMECADTLYGVTMAQPGVSKLVSVQI